MKAAVHTRYGPPSVVQISDVEKPTARPDELLIRVHATTVNRTDCAYRMGRPIPARVVYGLMGPRATILGNEFAGDVEAVGASVTQFQVGDKVFGYNEGRFGGHAEYVVIPEGGSVATIPANISYEHVAPGTEGFHYALSVIRAARIQPAHSVLVNGATGGIGSAAVQLLTSLGAHVTAVCAAEHTALVTDLGAERTIDFTAEDFTQDAHTYDVVLDSVGKSSFGACRRLLKQRGIYLSSELGPLSQNPLLALITPVLRGKKVVFPIPKHNQEMVEYASALIGSGEFKPVVDRTYPLDEIVEAYHYVETGRKIGNVVIAVATAD